MTSRVQTDAKVSRIEVACLGFVVIGAFALLLPALPASRESARANLCRQNLRTLDLVTQKYVDAKGKLPPTNAWPTELLALLKNPSGHESAGGGHDVFSMPRPVVLTCPSRPDVQHMPGVPQVSHYALIVDNNETSSNPTWAYRDVADVPDEPDVTQSWFIGGLLTRDAAEAEIRAHAGPHANGSFLESDGRGESTARGLALE